MKMWRRYKAWVSNTFDEQGVRFAHACKNCGIVFYASKDFARDHGVLCRACWEKVHPDGNADDEIKREDELNA